MKQKVFLASDHRGLELKDKIIEYLDVKGYDVEDMGPYEYKEWDDYPDYIVPTMYNVQDHENSRAIIICKNGVGVSILANKFKGVRAGLCFNDKHVETARKDDDINVLALPSSFITDEEALETVLDFLETDFSKQERHVRRLDKIADVESQNFE